MNVEYGIKIAELGFRIGCGETDICAKVFPEENRNYLQDAVAQLTTYKTPEYDLFYGNPHFQNRRKQDFCETCRLKQNDICNSCTDRRKA